MDEVKKTFAGKVALVTGAGNGIGRAISLGLAADGACVVAADMSTEGGMRTVRDIREAGGHADFIQTDLRAAESIEAMLGHCEKAHGRLDILVCSARPKLKIGSYVECMEEWDLALDVLLRAPAFVARYALPLMERHGGVIINVGSTNASTCSHQPPGYHAAKAGLEQLTRYLARDYAAKGIRAYVVSPGLVDIPEDGRQLTAKPKNKAIAEVAVPMKRACRLDEIYGAVKYLCSDTAGFITGQVLTLDGGIALNDHYHVAYMAFTAGMAWNKAEGQE